uniref:Pyruvate kinase n=1 Tax=Compsopogon caeruleus TaxID=31354 RepID=A0A7S1XGR5_9RHOD|mmetsp:Transcript_7151/g.14711  ORF Transcript_7151/g.14711 Transcript_7151/m.14711 type:complete len:501 (+) Transcript_7151:193-1695(+)
MEAAFTRSVSSLRGTKENDSRQRKTGIICTIGPKVANKGMLGKLLDAGMNVMRLNFSHGSHEYHASCIQALREALAERPGKICAIALDTKGPEIRTGLLENHEDVTIEPGSEVEVTTDDAFKEAGNAGRIWVDYKDLPTTLKPGMNIFIDDGLLNLEVVKCNERSVICYAVNRAVLSERKGVNLPNAQVTLPAVSEKDKADLLFGVEQRVDVIFASFIRRAEQVDEIRAVLGEKGSYIKIYSKIENQEGLDNFDDILKVTDGVMVARGDLGIEIPAQKVFTAQKTLIRKCNMAGKPVICATQMLESMIVNPRPTRAEVSDVGNAIVDGADCVMLSGETAKGKYPLDAVEMMDEIAREAEGFIDNYKIWDYMKTKTKRPISNQQSIAASAVGISFDEDFKMIILISETGQVSCWVSKYRPQVPVFSITKSDHIARQTILSRGILPIVVPDFIEVGSLINMATMAGKANKLCESGDKVIVIHDTNPTDGVEDASVLRIVTVE